MRLHVKLEHNLLIQGLIELKWMSKEAVPLLSTKMYEAEASTVGKLRAHGLTSEAIFEAAIYANKTAKNPLPVIDLTLMKPMGDFDFSTFASLDEMLAQFVMPIMQLGDRLIVATADPSNAKFFDILALRSPFQLEYWIAESEAIKAALLAKNTASIKAPATNTAKAQEDHPAEAATAVMPEMPTMADARIEPTLNMMPEEASDSPAIGSTEEIVDSALESDSTAVSSEAITIVGDEDFADSDYLDAETVRYIDTELEDEIVGELDDELNSTDDSNDRFALLQDSALDVDELESKSQAEEDQNSVEEFGSDMDVAEVELLNQHAISSKSIETEDFDTIDELEEVERDEEIGIIGDYAGNHQVEAIDVPQSSAMMLREVLDEVATPAKSALEADDIIEYINYILLDAITQKASDIHFEPYESSFRIRFRIDGILHKVYVVPEQYRHAIAARLKVMAELDIAEKRLPQDGHITICLDENGEDDNVDARISVIPTLWGEKVVIRLLDRSEMNFSLTKLGLNQNQKYQLQSAIERSQGLVLVTGPTGSGKTVTLYACLNHLNEASKNIATVEDPVEINLEGINQLQVHPKIGLTFAEALRAFLRQDPDVLMVGEIRDYETADITMKAAQTGHLVLSTLHTNSAVESLVRLKNMGIESYNIASTVKLVIAQRLVRELCHCKEEDIVDSGYLETLGFTPQQAASKFYKASSCSECHDGYRGRIAIFEVMPISKRMEQMMLESAPAMEIRQQAEREGVKSLRQSGIEKVMEGRTSLEEILRVTTE